MLDHEFALCLEKLLDVIMIPVFLLLFQHLHVQGIDETGRAKSTYHKHTKRISWFARVTVTSSAMMVNGKFSISIFWSVSPLFSRHKYGRFDLE